MSFDFICITKKLNARSNHEKKFSNNYGVNFSQDGSTMLIEAAKGGHTNVVSYLLDYPNNVLSVPTTDVSQLTPPSQDQSQVK